MTVVLTGATGFLGSRLLRGLLATGRSITALGRDKDGQTLAARLHHALRAAGADHNELARAQQHLTAVPTDITQPHLGLTPTHHRQLAEQAKAIWHCAASVSLVETAHHLAPINVDATRHITELADLSPTQAPLIHISTLYLAPHPLTAPATTPPLSTDTTEPAGGYAQTKRQAEAVVHHWATSRRRTALLLRPGLLTTDRPVPADAPQQPLSTIKTAAEHLLQRLPLPLRHALAAPGSSRHRLRIRLALPPESHVNVLDVDYAVDAMLRLSRIPHDAGPTTYSVTHPVDTPITALVSAANTLIPGIALALHPLTTNPNPLEQQVNQLLTRIFLHGRRTHADDAVPLPQALPGAPPPALIDHTYLAAVLNSIAASASTVA
ncbi:SDR family oxidoreductase [Streptomyces sp. NPDC052396]|uniref:SDR family oxidoreductase n=1 Tax=Streptomyces sp. NPDC052396 TaxID=3365689 RepID=UPI0037CE2BA8